VSRSYIVYSGGRREEGGGRGEGGGVRLLRFGLANLYVLISTWLRNVWYVATLLEEVCIFIVI